MGLLGVAGNSDDSGRHHARSGGNEGQGDRGIHPLRKRRGQLSREGEDDAGRQGIQAGGDPRIRRAIRHALAASRGLVAGVEKGDSLCCRGVQTSWADFLFGSRFGGSFRARSRPPVWPAGIEMVAAGRGRSRQLRCRRLRCRLPNLTRSQNARPLFRDVAVLAVPVRDHVQLADVQNLSAQMDASGHLQWQIPPGKWRIFRFIQRPTGASNVWGLFCDTLSPEGIDHAWALTMASAAQGDDARGAGRSHGGGG